MLIIANDKKLISPPSRSANTGLRSQKRTTLAETKPTNEITNFCPQSDVI